MRLHVHHCQGVPVDPPTVCRGRWLFTTGRAAYAIRLPFLQQSLHVMSASHARSSFRCAHQGLLAAPHSLGHRAVDPFSALQWDPAGDLLAVLPSGQGFAILWAAATREVTRVDTGLKVRLAVHRLFLADAPTAPPLPASRSGSGCCNMFCQRLAAPHSSSLRTQTPPAESPACSQAMTAVSTLSACEPQQAA